MPQQRLSSHLEVLSAAERQEKMVEIGALEKQLERAKGKVNVRRHGRAGVVRIVIVFARREKLEIRIRTITSPPRVIPIPFP